MASAAEVKHLVVTHFRAGRVDEESVRAMLRAGGFDGQVTFGSGRTGDRGVKRKAGRVARVALLTGAAMWLPLCWWTTSCGGDQVQSQTTGTGGDGCDQSTGPRGRSAAPLPTPSSTPVRPSATTPAPRSPRRRPGPTSTGRMPSTRATSPATR